MANTKDSAVLDKPVEPLVETPKKDNGLRTVLHGWGKLAPNEMHDVDKYTFVGGVARNVPLEDAEAMMSRRNTPGIDGKVRPKYGYIVGHILPSDATDADFIKATGIRPMPLRSFASMLGAYDANELRGAMGDEKALEFTRKLMESFGIK